MGESREPVVTRGETGTPERMEPAPTLAPRVDVIEGPQAYVVRVDMPAVKKGDVNVTLEGGELTIRGKVSVPGYERMVLDRHEYDVADFHRSVELGPGLD